MDVTTSYPVIHLYGGRHLMCTGKGGETYASGKGLAIEAQFHTGSLNYVSFSNNTFLQNRTKPLGPHTSREFADKTFAPIACFLVICCMYQSCRAAVLPSPSASR